MHNLQNIQENVCAYERHVCLGTGCASQEMSSKLLAVVLAGVATSHNEDTTSNKGRRGHSCARDK
jgi:hypothetical protein